MKKENFINLSTEELISKCAIEKQELHKLNYQRKSGRVDKPHLFSKHKKDVARIQTQLTNLRYRKV